MTPYIAPVDEYRFLLQHVMRDEFARVPGAERAEGDVLTAVLEGIGRFAKERVAPLRASSDVEGCRLDNGIVRTPLGYRDAYGVMVDDGWTALHVAEADGGQGLPITVAFAGDEFLSSGTMSFALYPALRLGVYKVLQSLGRDLDPVFLRMLGSGAWTGTMCLTEPQCGTDLALIRTEAVADGNGSYLVTGTKIFISCGDHDVTENIVHLVLARIKGGPKGLSGLGLFVVPKLREGSDGRWNAGNNLRCTRLENKLGIHGSATAELLFDGARGHLLGQPGEGLAGMFVIMKMARVGTSFQAVGVAEAAHQAAVAYARERVQGRNLAGSDQGSVAIINHPNIRRELLRMRTLTASARMLGAWAAISLDRTESADPQERAHAETLLSILMPISKVVTSETGTEVATAAMHVLGGHGYIRDNGVEVMLRDVSILPIYEGTNDIQALDVVLRRVGAKGGVAVEALFDLVDEQLLRSSEAGVEPNYVRRVAKTLDQARVAAKDLSLRLATAPFGALQTAKDFTWLLGHLAIGSLWLRVLAQLATTDDLPVDKKAKTAEAAFHFAYIHPDADLRTARLAAADAVQGALLSDLVA